MLPLEEHLRTVMSIIHKSIDAPVPVYAMPHKYLLAAPFSMHRVRRRAELSTYRSIVYSKSISADGGARIKCSHLRRRLYLCHRKSLMHHEQATSAAYVCYTQRGEEISPGRRRKLSQKMLDCTTE